MPVIPRAAILALLLASLVASAQAAPRTLVEWDFAAAQDSLGWVGTGHIADLRVEDGALRGRAVDWDPILYAAPVDFATSAEDVVELTLVHATGGLAQIFFTNTLDTQYGGFSPEKCINWELKAGTEPVTYRIHPWWQAEGRIIRLRVDLPSEGEFAIRSIRVVQGDATAPATPDWTFPGDADSWRAEDAEASATADSLLARPVGPGACLMAPPTSFDAEERPYVTVRLATTAGSRAAIRFAASATNGAFDIAFDVVPDGELRTYNIEACGNAHWRGDIVGLGLVLPEGEDAGVRLASLSASDAPSGPAQFTVSRFGLEEVSARVGAECLLTAEVANSGGETDPNAVARIVLPDGVSVLDGPSRPVAEAEFGFPVQLEWHVRASRALTESARIEVVSERARVASREAEVEFTEPPQVQPAAYVPAPEPVESDYRVGAYYFPGWESRTKWNPIEGFPERKPLLGWYDESLPEVADWQIKWAVEHGISFFCVDWYWSAGSRSLEHWLHNSYEKSRYRDQLDFCLLWANHNPPKTSSLEDCLAVTRYWIDNYFQRPEYVRVDGKPVVVIFSPWRFRDDMGSAAVREAFDAMDKLCQAEGIPGICMVACAGSSASEIQQLADEGYDGLSGYNYPGLGAGGKLAVPYEDLLPEYVKLWNEAADAAILPEYPAVSGGWDSRPWHGADALARTGRTPELFERHLRDVREFLDTRHGDKEHRLCIIEAMNEWGEGSYIEPHREFGFGYLDAVRRVFTDAPEAHQDLTPSDVGLGPYDFPRLPERTSWDFDDGTDQGWGSTMALDRTVLADGTLRLVTTGIDPAVFGPRTAIRAATSRIVEIRMKSDAADGGQLFFATTTGSTSEGRSIQFGIEGDGQYHTYRLDMSAVKAWRGKVVSLRLDVGTRAGTTLDVDWIRVVEE